MDNSLIGTILIYIWQFFNFAWPIFTWGLIIYILSSWFPALRESSFGEFLGKVYEPLLEPFRRMIPPLGGVLDLSPIILIIIFSLFQRGMNEIFRLILNLVV
ncbi:cell division protein [Jeotgalicoccus coquinae]|uniref:YGGT family protein n=1 Tax=Jeotgalicoccus coquinae TaxID=709509 RepID=A0A6V7RKX6_9STAP|nr:YggT family protein [Jeotgalicoccus coquinae]GGE15071.1 cell division protein [Jeotgalicoccus coquinae]CAD2078169.1 YGGT family protein [Jeotgalicoccus coquinae]